MNEAVKQSGYAAGMLRLMLKQLGARLGLVWIGLLAFAAVFAPLLANSRPLLLSEHGHLQSPALAAFTPADATLLLMFLSSGILFWPRLPFLRRLAIWLAGGAIITTLSLILLHPPQITVYEQYREAEAAGRYDWVVHAPIPYSARDYQRDRGDVALQAPLADPGHVHWLGTDANGADVLSRMIHASRIALAIGFIATGIAMLIGTILGGLMGYFSGIVDIVGMRLVEIFEAVPTLFLLLTFVAFFGRSLYLMMVIIGLTAWPGYARYVRAEYLKLRAQDFVQAAVAGGLPLRSILFRHMLPNAMAPLLVAASFGVASAILAEATLSFLGLGLVDSPSWGQMLNQAVQSSTFYWWMAIFPGGAIFFTVFAYNLIGEALRDVIDPYLQR
ncbi:MAG: ABC transporter permease [Gammaproteobacteria bacterium]|jgi:peptide/nickel transport system permease protein